MDMTPRKLKILKAIILNYVKTAEPVGSRTLAKQMDMKISPATIRNEMSDLEEMGYLTHPHTSAGRVPADKAYRLYVNDMMSEVDLPQDEKELINNELKADIDEFDKTIERAAELLSEITNLASFAISPTQDEDKIAYIDLLPVSDHQVILIISTEGGRTSNTMIRLNTPFTDEQLRILSKNMTYNYRSKKLTDVVKSDIIKDFKGDMKALSQIEENVLPNFMKTLSDMLDVHLYIDGLSHMFDLPEFSDRTKAKNFVSMFDRSNQAKFTKTLMNRDNGMIVTIGTENPENDLTECSLITATYEVDGKFAGKVGVIGPTRMRYGEITSIVQYLTDNLNRTFRMEEGGDEDDEDGNGNHGR